MDYSLFFDKDSVFGKVSAKLLHGSIQLLEFEPSGSHRALVRFSFTDLAVGAEYRMKTDTTILSASLQVYWQFTHSSLLSASLQVYWQFTLNMLKNQGAACFSKFCVLPAATMFILEC